MAKKHKFHMLGDAELHEFDLDNMVKPDQAICIDVGAGPLSNRQKNALDHLLKIMAVPDPGEPSATFALYTRMPGTKPPA